MHCRSYTQPRIKFVREPISLLYPLQNNPEDVFIWFALPHFVDTLHFVLAEPLYSSPEVLSFSLVKSSFAIKVHQH